MRNGLWAMLVAAALWWTMGAQAQVTPDPVNLTALWYDQSQAGHGVNVVHQGSILFVAWYVYGSDGKVLWLVAAATRQADGRYIGPLNSFTGVPFNQINNAQSNIATNARGEARLSLGADGKLDFAYTVDGIVHFCVPNLPSVAARSATLALTSVQLPYISAVARDGVESAALEHPRLARGVYLHQGACVHPSLARVHGLALTPGPPWTAAAAAGRKEN